MDTPKIKITKDLLHIRQDNPITWKDIKDFQFENDDIFYVGYEEPFYSENNSWDGHYFCLIQRLVEETDEEYAERIKEKKENSEKLRRLRLKQYLKLKQEFENEQSILDRPQN